VVRSLSGRKNAFSSLDHLDVQYRSPNMPHLMQSKRIFPTTFEGDMLVSWKTSAFPAWFSISLFQKLGIIKIGSGQF